MKKDMARVLNEDGRNGGGIGFPRHYTGTVSRDSEDLPVRQGMRRVWSHCYNERGGPARKAMKRFLASRVGRRWDNVFREICRHNRQDNFVQRELRGDEFLEGLVEFDIVLVDGAPYRSTGMRVWENDFWVHPESGVLLRVPPAKRQRPRYLPASTGFEQLPIDQNHKYVRVQGIWYWVEFASIPVRKNADDKSVEYGYDIIFHERVVAHADALHPWNQCREWQTEWGGMIYAAAKRQISKKELSAVRERFAGKQAA